MVCQQASKEALKRPFSGPGSRDKSGPYQSSLSRVCAFKDLNVLPNHLMESLTAVCRRLPWLHIRPSGNNKFNQDRLDRAKKRGELDAR